MNDKGVALLMAMAGGVVISLWSVGSDDVRMICVAMMWVAGLWIFAR